VVHANLNWTFGPLRFVFASPVFHRWHHTTLEEGLNKNFAPTFPFLDLVFGTFYMPPGKLPEQFGNGESDFPEDFWGQFCYPFRKSSKQLSNAVNSLPPPSFPSSAWERTSGSSASRPVVGLEAKQSFAAVRSQAELGNEDIA
jgi:hypothetical protein